MTVKYATENVTDAPVREVRVGDLITNTNTWFTLVIGVLYVRLPEFDFSDIFSESGAYEGVAIEVIAKGFELPKLAIAPSAIEPFAKHIESCALAADIMTKGKFGEDELQHYPARAALLALAEGLYSCARREKPVLDEVRANAHKEQRLRDAAESMGFTLVPKAEAGAS